MNKAAEMRRTAFLRLRALLRHVGPSSQPQTDSPNWVLNRNKDSRSTPRVLLHTAMSSVCCERAATMNFSGRRWRRPQYNCRKNKSEQLRHGHDKSTIAVLQAEELPRSAALLSRHKKQQYRSCVEALPPGEGGGGVFPLPPSQSPSRFDVTRCVVLKHQQQPQAAGC